MNRFLQTGRTRHQYFRIKNTENSQGKVFINWEDTISYFRIKNTENSHE